MIEPLHLPELRRHLPGGTAAALLAGLAFAAMALGVHACEGRVPPGELLFLRGLAGLALLYPMARSHLGQLADTKAASLWLRCVTGAAAVGCQFVVLQNTSPATAASIGRIGPVLVLVVGWSTGRDVLHGRALAGTLLATMGPLLLFQVDTSPTIGVIALSLCASVLATIAVFSLRSAAQRFSASVTTWALSGLFVVAGAAEWLISPVVWVVPRGSDLVWTAAVIIGGIVGQVLATRSYATLPTPIANSLGLLGIVWVVVGDALLFGRVPGVVEAASYVAVGIGCGMLAHEAEPHRLPLAVAEQPPAETAGGLLAGQPEARIHAG